jgi:hypothetical protein
VDFSVKGLILSSPSLKAGQSVSIASKSTSLSVVAKIGIPLQVVLPGITKGSKILATISAPNGQKINLPSIISTSSGAFRFPNLSFLKSGKYVLTILIAKVKKIVKVTVI